MQSGKFLDIFDNKSVFTEIAKLGFFFLLYIVCGSLFFASDNLNGQNVILKLWVQTELIGMTFESMLYALLIIFVYKNRQAGPGTVLVSNK